MQPTIKELEEKYNQMRDDQILSLLEDEGMREDAVEALKWIIKKRWLEAPKIQEKKNNTHYVKKTELKPEESLNIQKKIRNLGIFMQICWILIALVNILVLQSITSAELLGIWYGWSVFMSGRIMYKNKAGDSYKYIKELLIIACIMILLWGLKFDFNMIVGGWIFSWYLNDKYWKSLKLLHKDWINNFYLWCMLFFWVLFYLGHSI